VVIATAGTAEAPIAEPEQRLIAWLRRHRERFGTIVSICTGAFVLGGAGLLDGKRVTTHWNFLDVLRKRFPAATVVDEGIYCRDEDLWTSAGVAAGIDLALAFVEHDHGRDLAMAVARRLVLFLRRSGHQAQFSAALQRQSMEPARLRDLSTFVIEHAAEAMPVERMAKEAGMSVRSLSRWCKQEFGEAPAEFVRRLRIDEARAADGGGDGLAGRIGRASVATQATNIGEYHAHERRLLVPSAEARQFIEEVDALREQTDRLAARVAQLEARETRP
jgi:transcriptional regulator GlxA family with amidase domain